MVVMIENQPFVFHIFEGGDGDMQDEVDDVAFALLLYLYIFLGLLSTLVLLLTVYRGINYYLKVIFSKASSHALKEMRVHLLYGSAARRCLGM